MEVHIKTGSKCTDQLRTCRNLLVLANQVIQQRSARKDHSVHHHITVTLKDCCFLITQAFGAQESIECAYIQRATQLISQMKMHQ